MTTPPAPSSGAAREDVLLGTAALRVLAHPLRLQVLAILRRHGPSTATRVAGELGINPGAASYHLRRLAAGGLIEEERERGTGRERWWRAAHRQSIHDPATAPPEQREAGRAYVQALALAYAEHLTRAAQEITRLPDDWFGASAYSDFLLRITPQDLARMRTEIFDVIDRYRGSEPLSPEGSATVSVKLQAFPVPGTMPLGPGEA
ncbi:helix-turn-helix domain-containing protein [Streptomyces sp. NBC_00442]|uniref:ArsR/SmtB family transcription factor n=1 Tax=Streptomyces sp. NBC_00442 TaxID=2903651 RepID=UPI002E250FF7